MSSLNNIEMICSKENIVINFSKLNQQTVDELISIVRTVKQSNPKKVLLNLSDDTEIYEPLSYRERLDWSRQGQILTALVNSSSVPFVAIIKGHINAELSELATSCSFIMTVDDASINFGDGFTIIKNL